MKRPIFLTIIVGLILVFSALSSVFALINVLNALLNPSNVPLWMYGYILLKSVLTTIGAIMLWKWQKNGLFLLVGLDIFNVLYVIVITPQFLNIPGFILEAFFLLLIYLAMKPVWKNFK